MIPPASIGMCRRCGRRTTPSGAALSLALVLLWTPAGRAQAPPLNSGAPGDCRFAIEEQVLHLLASCVTDGSIVVPPGMELDGHGHAIVAVDPAGGSFRGGVVVARGGLASVVNTVVMTVALTAACHEGADRLRGIYFEDASGIIRHNTVLDIVMPTSACEEGIAIEVRHTARDAAAPRGFVEIVGNDVSQYQKGGVLVHGPVDAFVHLNEIGVSASERLLSANAIQVGPRAWARISSNTVRGNEGVAGGAAGTAILLVDAAPGTSASRNRVLGGDVGIYVRSDGVFVEDNEVVDEGPDGSYDVGIVNVGVGNVLTNNAIRGYDSRYYGLEQAAPSPGGTLIE